MRYLNFLQTYRRRTGLSQGKLAEKLGDGTSRPIISAWETGLSCPPPDKIKRIAEILKVEEKKIFP